MSFDRNRPTLVKTDPCVISFPILVRFMSYLRRDKVSYNQKKKNLNYGWLKSLQFLQGAT